MAYTRQVLNVAKCDCCGEEFQPNRRFQRFKDEVHRRNFYRMAYELGTKAVEEQVNAKS